ncbi:MAG: DUF2807 domain-containing protein [Bacteroidales bacterium]|nr:DUF2807 domain-containing protein [Bacteroidales bacterium]
MRRAEPRKLFEPGGGSPDCGCEWCQRDNLVGRAESVEFDGSGTTSLDALELITNTASISISGAGDARIHATEELSAKVSGAGSIRYTGNPTKINKSISGAGSINKR